MSEINPRHRKKKLEKYIGKNVRVTFKDGHFVEGVLTHHGWRYGMDDCEWHSKILIMLISVVSVFAIATLKK